MSEKQYRVVENIYTNRIEWEDGRGSLQNIVSDVRKKVLREWNEPSDTPLNEVTRHAQRFVPHTYWYDDPGIESSYQLQSRDSDEAEWRFIDLLLPIVVREYPEEYSDCEKEYEEYCEEEKSRDKES